jgi:hypothetical protein
MDINFDNVKSKLVDRGVQVVQLSNIGFVLTNEDICRYNAIVILSNMSNVESKLSEEQQQNLIAMYNELIVMQ